MWRAPRLGRSLPSRLTPLQEIHRERSMSLASLPPAGLPLPVLLVFRSPRRATSFLELPVGAAWETAPPSPFPQPYSLKFRSSAIQPQAFRFLSRDLERLE